jgi:hypothetical protein
VAAVDDLVDQYRAWLEAQGRALATRRAARSDPRRLSRWSGAKLGRALDFTPLLERDLRDWSLVNLARARPHQAAPL